MKLAGKVAVVTGGGIGIGRKTALLLAKEGAKVIVTDIDQESGQATVDEILALNGEAIFVPQDINEEKDWTHVVTEAFKVYNQIDMLFNNAGLYQVKQITGLQGKMGIRIKDIYLEIKQLTSSVIGRGEFNKDLPLAGIIGSGQGWRSADAAL
jgi:NAD(P)-dependent dehydrogenase (short-subunit alcohol dehydrogenase family)